MIKDTYTITEQNVYHTDLFNDILQTDKPFIKTRFRIAEDIDKTEFLRHLEGELIWKYEENPEFTLDIREANGDWYVLMLGKKIYDDEIGD